MVVQANGRVYMVKRRYSDEERAACLAALAANAGDIARTARQVGVPYDTLRSWAIGKRHPESVQMSEAKKIPLAQQFEDLAHQLLGVARDKAADLTGKEAVVSAAVAVDKMRLLRGESTDISEQRDDDRLAEFRKRYPPSDAASVAGADRRPQSPDTAPAQRQADQVS